MVTERTPSKLTSQGTKVSITQSPGYHRHMGQGKEGAPGEPSSGVLIKMKRVIQRFDCICLLHTIFLKKLFQLEREEQDTLISGMGTRTFKCGNTISVYFLNSAFKNGKNTCFS